MAGTMRLLGSGRRPVASPGEYEQWESKKLSANVRPERWPGWGVLFQLHHQAILRTAYGIVRSYDLAEDVTQQVFIELFASIKRYDVTRPFSPWLHRIAVNRSLDAVRRRKNRTVSLEAAGDLPSPSTSPEQAAEQSELRAVIRDVLGTLDAKYRAAVVLRYYHGFSEAEMAVALHCRRGTVKSRLHYALRRVREILAAQASSTDAHGLTQPTPPPCGERGGRLRCPLSPEEERLGARRTLPT